MNNETQILEILTLLIFIAAIVGLATRRLRVPYTVGLVLMGLLIGFLNQQNTPYLLPSITHLVDQIEKSFTPEIILGLREDLHGKHILPCLREMLRDIELVLSIGTGNILRIGDLLAIDLTDDIIAGDAGRPLDRGRSARHAPWTRCAPIWSVATRSSCCC